MADDVDAGAVAVNVVNDMVRQAVEGIDVTKRRQKLKIKGTVQQTLPLTDRDVQHIVNLLQQHPRAVDALLIDRCSLSLEALEILRAYFATRPRSLRFIHFAWVNIGNVNGSRLLSGLHGNKSITRLDLVSIGLEGPVGGDILSSLLQHTRHLEILRCDNLRLGVEGARALQPGIRANQTLRRFWLNKCQFGNEGSSLIVDALQGNTTMTGIGLDANGITSNGLPHVTRLLHHSSLRDIDFDNNPGLFDSAENTRDFSSALQDSQVAVLTLCYCRLPGDVIVALFQALSAKTTPTRHFCVYDSDPLPNADLERLLEQIPQIRNLHALHINLDFTAESVLSSFCRNASIQHLRTFNGTAWQSVTNGPVFDILKRNRRLCQANTLLDSEPGRMVPLGLWSTGIECLTCDDNTGATAVFKIMQEKLVMWWAPDTLTRTSAVLASPSTAVSSAATSSLNSSVKRSHAQASMGHDDDGATDAKSSPSSSTEPQCKQQRRHLSPSKSTGKDSSITATATTSRAMNNDKMNMDSLSRAELVELIKQKDEQISQKDEMNSQLVELIKQKDEKISQLVSTISQQDINISNAVAVLTAKSSSSEGGNMDNLEEDQKMPAVATTSEQRRVHQVVA